MSTARQNSVGAGVGLLLLRCAAAAPLLLAGIIKVQGDPLAFSLAIDSFGIVPKAFHLPLAYYLPWLELLLGIALVLGLWTRQAALGAALLFGAFTLGLAAVLGSGKEVDCGCFGGLFGDSTVSWVSVARNGVFIALALASAFLGGGRFAATTEQEEGDEPGPIPVEALSN